MKQLTIKQQGLLFLASRYIRSFIYNIYFFTVSAFCAIFGLFFLFGSRKTAFFVPQFWERALNFGAKWILGLTYRVEGAHNIPKGPCIIASKHQSAWETFTFCGIFPFVVFVAKRELGRIPIVGWHFRKQKTIFVDRRLGVMAKADMVRQAKERIAEGDQIVIYPEGTRVPIGKKIKYKQGIIAMYNELNVPVLPVALNSGVYWPRRSFLKYPGEITVSILPPIQPGLSAEEFMNQLESVIENRSQELQREASQITSNSSRNF